MSDTGMPAPPAAGQVGKPRGVGITILLFIVTLGIYGFWWWGYSYAELKRYRGEGLGGPLGVVFALIPILNIVSFFILGSEVEAAYRGDGKEPPVTAIWGLLIFIPLVGGIIWLWKVQSALNDFWVSKGATPV
jgi:hypothetical protein